MKVLIYIEPHPIRGVATHFNAAARRLLPHLGQNALDIRMYTNSATFEKLGIADPSSRPDRFVVPTDIEEELFHRFLATWDANAVDNWLDLMAGTEIALEYEALLERIWLRFPFDAVVYWGENGAVRNFCAKSDLLSLGMELGCTRPPFLETVCVDPLGTNGSAVPANLSIGDLVEITGGLSLSAERALSMFSRGSTSETWRLAFDPLSPVELERFLARGKVAFLPLQLYDDANLLRFSRYSTVRDVVLDVVPKLARSGWNIVIRPHPASAERGSAVVENGIARSALERWRESVFWLEGDSVPTATLMSKVDLVVTVNSSVGFEALFYDRPVVVIGNAIYKPEGVFPSLDAVIEGTVDWDRYFSDIGILRQFMLGGYLQPASFLKSRTLFERLIFLHLQLRREGASPRTIAGAVYESHWRANIGQAQMHSLYGPPEPLSARPPVKPSTPRRLSGKVRLHGGPVAVSKKIYFYLRRRGWRGIGELAKRLHE